MNLAVSTGACLKPAHVEEELKEGEDGHYQIHLDIFKFSIKNCTYLMMYIWDKKCCSFIHV